jgi:uncharacterized repeat protein (TIGR01451 family)
MGKGVLRWVSASILSVAIFAAGVGPGMATVVPGPSGDAPVMIPGTPYPELDDETEARLLALDQAFITRRTAGDTKLSAEQAGADRSKAANVAEAISKAPKAASGPITFNNAWTSIGPAPIGQIQRSDGALTAESGRIGALVIRKDGTFILGAAQGGIWTYDSATGVWTNRTDSLPSLSTGALAVAPSNDLVVYDGTGEGALSGDSYFGNGILKSTDGGMTWKHVSGDYFAGVSISRLAVDPENASHLYAAVLRGRGGDLRVSPPIHSAFGIWESKDGGSTWKLLKAAPAGSLGATELRMDPLNSKVLYSSFWADKIYKSIDGGKSWAPIMNGLPTDANFAAALTRFNIGLSHPAGQPAVLYTGFDWIDNAGHHQAARLFKSTDQGASWVALPTGGALPEDSVLDYCGTQCFYDNVIETDPTNPNVVFAAGSFGYNLSPQSGGVFRSDDGGMTWKNLGWDQHPDFHALAFDPNNPANVLLGSDGGVWYSTTRGGRPNASDPLSANDWQDLNGVPDGSTNGLAITQFSSIANNPTRTARFWGGTQDNGTVRKAAGLPLWYDMASGDGGHVQVDPTNWHFVYGTYFGVSPWRISDGGGTFFSNTPITNGISTSDRSDFYIPLALNQLTPSQLYAGTYRLYRTNNANAPSAADVKFTLISPDLTSGCTGAASNGARTCALSAIGVGGGTAVYTGSLDGLVYMSPDAQVSSTPTWTLLGSSGQNGNGDGQHSDTKLPQRPVSQIAVDRSNYRVAYLAYAGFNAATPKRPGHVFSTNDGGQSFQDISSNLPDTPVNSIVLDPSYPNTLYAGTDVGAFVTYNGGARWYAMGTGFPVVSINQLDLDTFHRMIVAGTHGRSAWSIADTSAPAPALVLTKTDAGVPVGPGSNIDYTLTVHNIGAANATGVEIKDTIPAHTSFVSADNGGTYSNGQVTWTGKTVPASVPTPNVTNPVPTTNGGSFAVHMTVRIDSSLEAGLKSIVNDTFRVVSAEGPSATGSPTVTPLAPPYAVTMVPASQTDGAKVGKSVTYQVTISNRGYKTDSYNMSSAGGTFAVSFFDPTCTTALTATPALTAGQSTNVCVKVDVPANAANGATSTATVTATSVASPTVSASASIKTIAVAVATLVVDDDSFVPSSSKNADVNSYYTTALTTAGIQFSLWDLGTDKNLPQNYLMSFSNVVWFTGNSYPSPVTIYEPQLKAFLDNGGRIFMSGQDMLDQAGGTTSFVANYLHVNWNDATMNDIATKNVNGVSGTITNGAGTVPLDTTVLANSFMDEIGVNPGATAIFTDDAGKADGLSFSGTYKVVFLAFPFEEYGTAAQRAAFMTSVFNFFG